MELINTVQRLKTFVENEKKVARKIAFTPTMGALHNGHLSLINISKKFADTSICSIYVNPSQFNNEDDLKKYPRTLDSDSRLLEFLNCDILFAPPDEEVYPTGLNTELSLDFGELGKCMEGQFRPGHFKGMLEVVKRLLDIVNPDYLVMGQKDFQQFTLVGRMIQQLDLPVKLIIGPTLREADGLAMSSRNQRLSKKIRTKVPIIYRCLTQLKDSLFKVKPVDLVHSVKETLEKAGLKPEYVEIVDGKMLSRITDPDDHNYIVACTAVWAGDVRLIDNIILKGSPE